MYHEWHHPSFCLNLKKNTTQENIRNEPNSLISFVKKQNTKRSAVGIKKECQSFIKKCLQSPKNLLKCIT